MISQGPESGEEGRRIRGDLEVVELAVVFSSSSWTSSSIGEREDSKEREFNREPPATVQFVEELHEVVELVFSESIVFRCVGDQCP